MNQPPKTTAGITKKWFTNPQVWGSIIAVAVMVVISLAFFYPDSIEGNDLRQHDMQQGLANGQEAKAFTEATGEDTRWTNSLFSGMPTFQIAPSYPSNSLFSWLNVVYGCGLPSPSNLLFMMMAGFFILMLVLKIRWYYGLIGAVAWAFSTYFIIIIGAGHIWKFLTLTYVPPTIAGIILAYRGHRLAGGAIAALFAMLQIASNHVQMTYYFSFVILGIMIACLVKAVIRKEVMAWTKSTAALVVAAALAVAANLPSLYNTYEYSKETIRGGHSELTVADGESTGKGLDRDYITQYSYGRGETFSLLIPNVKGGASARPEHGQMKPMSVLDVDGAEDIARSRGLNQYEYQYIQYYVSQYFGEPEGTNGPVYVGAIIVALFILGCIIVRGPLKWAFLSLTILSILLAWGRNFMSLTDLFIDIVPMYNKFRTPESILVIAEFCMPVIAILGLYKFLTADKPRRYLTPMIVSFGIAAFFCFIGWVWPSVYGSGISDGDRQLSEMISQGMKQQGYPEEAVSMLSIYNPKIALTVEDIRLSMVSADAGRSLLFILLATVPLLLAATRRLLKPAVACSIVGVLVFGDLYSVNKRYLNHDSFVENSASATPDNRFPLSDADRYILQDTTSNYRVMALGSLFYAAAPSYHHKAIGGYHAAKLTRYQDLIERHLAPLAGGQGSESDLNVVNMLNGRYLIDQSGEVIPNPAALGNAWFVDSIIYVGTADEEMDALDIINPATTAVADIKFKELLGEAVPVDSTASIRETTYAPNRLTYHTSSDRDAIAVFSEVYFPWGWQATIDGEPAEIGRVDYVLRAMRIPAGEHTVAMTFDPRSLHTTNTVAVIAIILIYIALIAAVALQLRRKEK